MICKSFNSIWTFFFLPVIWQFTLRVPGCSNVKGYLWYPKEPVLQIRYNKHIKYSLNTWCSSVLKPIFTGFFVCLLLFLIRLRANHSSSALPSLPVYILDVALAVYIFPTFPLSIFWSLALLAVLDSRYPEPLQNLPAFFLHQFRYAALFIHSGILCHSFGSSREEANT